MLTPNDQAERSIALDPTQSFIVQAPAGSGKTELLIQRFLTLLTIVNAPEEVLAITFTKKAASEMRARIIKALKQALEPEPISAHAKKTWSLAKTVLERDTQFNWQLIQNPNQLRIQTIDALCTYLTKQMPLLSQFGSQPDIEMNPSSLYREAVFEVLMHVEEDVAWSEAISHLLLHLDNDLNKLHDLLVSLLAKRDQWLPYIQFHQDDIEIRHQLETYLKLVVTEHLSQLPKLLPSTLQAEVIALSRYAANNLILSNTDSPIRACQDWVDLSKADCALWLGVAKLFLKADGDWRLSFDARVGFPAPSNFKNAEEKAMAGEYKQRAGTLIKALTGNDKLKFALNELNHLPSTKYTDHQWNILQALLHVLKVVAAQLRMTFQQQGKIDFIENSQAALTTLGMPDNPTDLALALDYRLCHILIDEFQDTSLTQYDLLRRLTAGWTNGDGRTLFVVGDPMQSIYRFREAEVGLFIRMQQYGIGDIKLQPLALSVNFRSAPGIVEWNNEHFEKIFPAESDMSTGAVNYSPSTANKTDEAFIEVKGFSQEDEQQTQYIIDCINKTLDKHPHQSIAILVRSRSHLTGIIPALKKAGISYRAVDIDPLASRQHIQDLLSLTCALLHPADRIAWLAILRAPWCGLTLSDLQLLVGSDTHRSLWESLNLTETVKTLSADGQQRINRILPILKTKIADRDRTTLREWIESTWLLLGGPACLEDTHQLQDADTFFDLLQSFSQQYHTIDLDSLKTTTERLFAASQNNEQASVQIMTIHSSKGLEFDTVILPHLERKMPNDDKALLSWMERSTADKTALLLAPIHATGKDTDAIYEYIHRQQKVKSDFESNRLLYVATTRAKQRLHLYFNIKTDADELKATPGSFLEKIWPFIKNDPAILANAKIENELKEDDEQPARHIKRLATEWKNPVIETVETKVATHLRSEGFILPNHTPKIIGIVIHRILQILATQGSSWWEKQSHADQMQYLRMQLLKHAINMQDLPKALGIAYQAIENTLGDERGQWILYPHPQSAAEFGLTAHFKDGIETLIIDRTFVDNKGIRWIIDYKTTAFSQNDLSHFLENEQKKYKEKMQQYAEAMSLMSKQSIKFGLYFPSLPTWYEWDI